MYVLILILFTYLLIYLLIALVQADLSHFPVAQKSHRVRNLGINPHLVNLVLSLILGDLN